MVQAYPAAGLVVRASQQLHRLNDVLVMLDMTGIASQLPGRGNIGQGPAHEIDIA